SSFQCFQICVNPFRSKASACNLHDVFISLRRFLVLFDFNYVTSFYLIRRDVYAFSVNQNVLVVNDLSCLFSGSRHTHTEYNVIQTQLKQDHQVFTSLASHSVCLLVVVTERFLQNAVDEFCFLFFSQLKTILRYFSVRSFQLSCGLFINTQIYRIQTQGPASFQDWYSIYCHVLDLLIRLFYVLVDGIHCAELELRHGCWLLRYRMPAAHELLPH